MDDHSIIFARSARKELERLDAALVVRIVSRIEHLAGNPRPANSIKVKGQGNLWRIRVGSYRVVDSIDEHNRIVDIIAVRHRRDAYR